MRALILSITFLLAGCAGADGTDETSTSADEARGDQADSTRASREGPVDPAVTTDDSAGDETPRLVLLPMEAVAEAEDGHGTTVPAVRAVAFDLDARLAPVRSSDPVLHIGGLVLERYEHPRPGILRFILADRDAIPEGAAVTLQYGDDESTQVVVLPVLELPW